MKISKKQIIIVILALVMALTAMLLSSCKDKNNQTDTGKNDTADTGNGTQGSTENGGQSEPIADLSINSFTVGYLSRKDYLEGDYDEGKITDRVIFEDESEAYMVVDFSVTLNKEVEHGKRISLDTLFPGRSLLDITIEQAPTSETEEIEYSDATVLRSNFSLPARVGDTKDIRVILRLMHLSGGVVNFELTLASDDDVSIAGPTSRSKALDTGLPRLIYSLNDDGKSYTVRGAHSELTDAVIPEALNNGFPVTSIKDGALKGHTALKTLKIGSNVTDIGEYAFMNCTALSEVTMGDGVLTIDNQAFGGCSALSSVYVSSLDVWLGIEFSGASSNPTYSAHDLFVDGELLTDLTIPEGVTRIKDNAFVGCDKIKRVTITNDLTSIDTAAFMDCDGLLGVYISSIESWCGIEFGSYSASPLYYAKNLYLNGELVTQVVIPEGIEEIEGFSFRNCTSITSVSVPSSVKTIKYGAFSDCPALTDVTVSGGVIGQRAFSECTALSRLGIGEGVTEIGYYAFEGCKALSYVDLPSSVKTLNSSAFADCIGLTGISIGAAVTFIGSDAFENCTKLTDVYYAGDAESWSNIKISSEGNEPLINATVHYDHNDEN
ncbi:MAG: leucine-rich repeat domain-containing protein [Ruminococcaceae bacterium]|nr:leucine-rich repeat domain-containing protein [Oscillospiraceae bacterium]